MSDLDEETKRILAEVDSDDSKKTPKEKLKKSHENVEGDIEYETNTEETDDSEW